MSHLSPERSTANYLTILHPQPDENKTSAALKEHQQIPLVIDTLSRYEHHHLLLTGESPLIAEHFLQAVAHYLAHEPLPKSLANSFFCRIDMSQLVSNATSHSDVIHDLANFLNSLSTYQRILICIDWANHESLELTQWLGTLLQDTKYRLIITGKKIPPAELNEQFISVQIIEPSYSESLAILKTYQARLENFHAVKIPDDTVNYALAMASRFLSGIENNIEKALQLLDSGAARMSGMADETDAQPPVSNTILATVISNWTHIPMTHLQHNKFKAADFINQLQQNIFGQEVAISLIGLTMQHARIQLEKKSGPLASFLFAGPANVGKTKTAIVMAEQLFGHKRALLHVDLDRAQPPTSLTEIKVTTTTEDDHSPSLLQAIQHTPYAIVLLKNVNKAPLGTLDLFQDIFSRGFCIDEHGNKYDFRNTIVIITTSLGAEKIIDLTQPQTTVESGQAADLMQLVLNDTLNEPCSFQPQHCTAAELCEEIMPELNAHFSKKLLRHLNIVPFILLDYTAVEKIIRLKMNVLIQQLHDQYAITLSYAPEVIRFLVLEALWRGEHTRHIDKLLEQHLYAVIAHELIEHVHDKSRKKQLILQLNDTGQLLRCDFVGVQEDTLYKL